MRASILLCFVVLASCVRDPEKQIPETGARPDTSVIPQRPVPTVVSRTRLDVHATGVSIDASGQRFIWVNGVGLHRVSADGVVELELAAARLSANATTQYEDVAIIDANRFALIAQNEGVIFERATGESLNRFCYLPGFMQEQDPSAWQLSRSLAYDPAEDRLYVQPQTFTGFGGALTGSQVGLFDPAISEPLEWQNIGERTFIAGGMAVLSRERTFFGMDTRLYQYDARASTFTNWWELSGIVLSVDGLAIDPKTHDLIVLDASTSELVELRVDGLR